MTAPPIFPLETALPGLTYPPPLGSTWPITKTLDESVGQFISSSGIRTRVIRRIANLWEFKVDFGSLQSDDAELGIVAKSLQTVMGFFMDQVGPYGAFLFLDPSDCTLTHQVLGTANGSRTQFPIVRTMGMTYAEPVGYVFSADITQVTVNGDTVGSGWLMTEPNILTFSEAPSTGIVTISVAKFYFQCTLPEKSPFTQQMSMLWTAQGIQFDSLVPNYPTLVIT